jgi:hypothetical protein
MGLKAYGVRLNGPDTESPRSSISAQRIAAMLRLHFYNWQPCNCYDPVM